jgi:hypothetical protein
MKKWLIGSLVGGLLLFIWQFIAWPAAKLHDAEFKYHPKQEEIRNYLSSVIKEDGQYVMPRSAPDATNDQMKADMQNMFGKPYAVVSYKSVYEANMVVALIRGFVVDIVIALLLIFLISSRTYVSVGSAWITALAAGLIGFLFYPYTENIWFQTPTAVVMGALMDWFVGYTLLGVWLGWWLKRNARAVSH